MNETPVTEQRNFKLIKTYISKMPSLSTTLTKVLEVCNDLDASPNDLNRVISLDPVLTGSVLRLINSAYYSLPCKVTSSTRAIILLGLNTVKNLALSTSVLESLGSRKVFKALSMDDFWAHSICVGVTAKSLAAIKDVPRTQREEYFVCGLLHDLGKIPLNNYLSDGYLLALESCKSEQGPPLNEAEDTVFGFNHCLVGKMITKKWGLGQTIIDSLAYHHNPDDANEETSQFVTIVSLANTFANSLAIGSAGDHVPEDSMIAYLLEKAGISQSSLADLRENVLDDIEKAKVFLQLSKRG